MSQGFVETLLNQPPIQPTYLKYFEDNPVLLIYKEIPVNKHLGENDVCTQEKEALEKSTYSINETNAELTGNPLNIDLGGNVVDSVESIILEKFSHRWSPDEVKHCPLPVREARRALNNILKDVNKSIQYPIYVVCNADDQRKTVLMGSHRTKDGYTATTIHVMAPLLLDDVERSIQKVITEHKTGCTKIQELKCCVKATYSLYGSSFINIRLEDELLRELNEDGHIYIDITSSKTDFTMTPINNSNMEMHAFISPGHRLLKLNVFWEELLMLQKLLDISFGSLNGEHNLSKSPMSSDAILHEISNVVSFSLYEPYNSEKQTDLSNFRYLDTVDKLWNILICCENTSILRESFNFLLKDLFNAQSAVHYVVSDCTNVCKVFNEVLKGRIAMGNVTEMESIELLFEMGVRKLKYDFQALLKVFSCDDEIESVWSSFYVKNINEKSCGVSRITKSITNMGIKMKPETLTYVYQLYVAAEILELVKSQVNLSEENLNRLGTALVEKYVKNSRLFDDLQIIPNISLQEVSFKLDPRDISFLRSHPSRWTMKLESGSNVTIFDLSDSPVIPPVIYNYGLPENPKSLMYYVMKINRVSRNF